MMDGMLIHKSLTNLWQQKNKLRQRQKFKPAKQKFDCSCLILFLTIKKNKIHNTQKPLLVFGYFFCLVIIFILLHQFYKRQLFF